MAFALPCNRRIWMEFFILDIFQVNRHATRRGEEIRTNSSICSWGDCRCHISLSTVTCPGNGTSRASQIHDMTIPKDVPRCGFHHALKLSVTRKAISPSHKRSLLFSISDIHKELLHAATVSLQNAGWRDQD